MSEVKNKSEFVRTVLKDIGALSANPPEDWKKQVEDALAKEKITMHQVMIYQVRRNAMEAAGLLPKRDTKAAAKKVAPKGKPGRKPGTKVAPKKSPKASGPSLSLDDLVKANKIADEFGGAEKLASALKALSTINSTVLG